MRPPQHSFLSPVVPQPTPFDDNRGSICPLRVYPPDGAEWPDLQVIYSHDTTTRGNHSHRNGWHYCYVVRGTVRYTEQHSDGSMLAYLFDEGAMFFTPPGLAHRMDFLEDTVLVVIGDKRRTQEEYEADLERVDAL